MVNMQTSQGTRNEGYLVCTLQALIITDDCLLAYYSPDEDERREVEKTRKRKVRFAFASVSAQPRTRANQQPVRPMTHSTNPPPSPLLHMRISLVVCATPLAVRLCSTLLRPAIGRSPWRARAVHGIRLPDAPSRCLALSFFFFLFSYFHPHNISTTKYSIINIATMAAC